MRVSKSRFNPNFKSFPQSLEQFFLTLGKNNCDNKIPFTNYSSLLSLLGKLSESNCDEVDSDDESVSSPKKTKHIAASVSGADHPKATRSSGSEEAIFKTFETKSEKEDAASIVVETTGSESYYLLFCFNHFVEAMSKKSKKFSWSFGA